MKLDEIVLAESIVERLKPIAEEISSLKLSNLNVTLSKRNSNYSMKYLSPNEIIIYSKHWDYKKLLTSSKGLSWFELCISHELGHHVNYAINPQAIWNYGSGKALNMIIEGFAEFFSLDLLPENVLSKYVVSSQRKKLLEVSCNSEYATGYRFFRAVTTKLGKEESFHILKTFDVTLKELKNPGTYINRRQNGDIQKNK